MYNDLIFCYRNSTGDPSLVNRAVKVMEILIENYAVSSLFGADNLQFFADVTSSGIVVTERFTFQYKCLSQQNMDRESTNTVSINLICYSTGRNAAGILHWMI